MVAGKASMTPSGNRCCAPTLTIWRRCSMNWTPGMAARRAISIASACPTTTWWPYGRTSSKIEGKSMADAEIVLIEHDGPVAIVTLNRPEALNALSRALSQRIGEAFAELQESKETRVAILKGSGRAICAGMDLTALSSGAHGRQSADTAEGDRHRRNGMAIFDPP